MKMLIIIIIYPIYPVFHEDKDITLADFLKLLYQKQQSKEKKYEYNRKKKIL